MSQINELTYSTPVHAAFSGNQDNLMIESGYVCLQPDADAEITGIESPVGNAIFTIVLLFNDSEYQITLKAKSELSLPANRFQMDTDIVIMPGEFAVFTITPNGLFNYGVFLDNQNYYYSVRDADPVDVAAGEVVNSSVIPGLDYKIIKYTEPHIFTGTETWVEAMTSRDVHFNLYNPIYFDITAADPFIIGKALTLAKRNNVQFIDDLISEAALGSLFKGSATGWTSAEKRAYNLFWDMIKFYGINGNVGEVLTELLAAKAITDGAGTVTVTNPFTGAATNVTRLDSTILGAAVDLCYKYKRIYPDGTV